jgi:hypothetical protein
MYGSLLVGEWYHHLVLHCTEVNNSFGFKEALDEFKRTMGWVLGFD